MVNHQNEVIFQTATLADLRRLNRYPSSNLTECPKKRSKRPVECRQDLTSDSEDELHLMKCVRDSELLRFCGLPKSTAVPKLSPCPGRNRIPTWIINFLDYECLAECRTHCPHCEVQPFAEDNHQNLISLRTEFRSFRAKVTSAIILMIAVCSAIWSGALISAATGQHWATTVLNCKPSCRWNLLFF